MIHFSLDELTPNKKVYFILVENSKIYQYFLHYNICGLNFKFDKLNSLSCRRIKGN
jgi:hypothetical protein